MHQHHIQAHRYTDPNTPADATIADVHALGVFGNVNAGLDRQHHSWLQRARHLVEFILPYIMHVHAQPVTRAMHIEPAVLALLDNLPRLPFEQAELSPSINQELRSAL